MIRFESIIKSELPPKGSNLWIDYNNILKIFSDGEWVPLCVFHTDEEVDDFMRPILKRISDLESAMESIIPIDIDFIVSLS